MLLLRLVELVHRADLRRNILRWTIQPVAPFGAAPETLDIGRGAVVFPAKTKVQRQTAKGLPVIVEIERGPVLQDVGERKSFGRVGRRRQRRAGTPRTSCLPRCR